MTSLEKAINLGYLFLTFKPQKKISIYAPLSSACIGMFQFIQKSVFDPNTCRWCPLGKLSHLGLEQLTITKAWCVLLHSCGTVQYTLTPKHIIMNSHVV